MKEITDIDDRPQPRDPATLLPHSRLIIVEDGYVAPTSHIHNDPLRKPLRSKLPDRGFTSAA